MIVIVTGGRAYNGTGLVEALDALERESSDYDPMMLIVGDARGADQIARDWAIKNSVFHKLHLADWDAYGKGAGPRRNSDMVKSAFEFKMQVETVICLAAPGGRGTADCVNRCREAGFEVREVTT